MTRPAIDCRKFADRVAPWLIPSGPDSDVVASCRVRLARNLDGFPFCGKLSPEEAVALCESAQEPLEALTATGPMTWAEMGSTPPVVRMLLRERHLVSRDLAPGAEERPVRPGRAVAFSEEETASVMVNEEDHLRIQSMAGGFDIDRAWSQAQAIDRELESRFSFACDPALGYLTSCPTNVGTGMRASVMLHLPALGLVRTELEKVFTAAQRTGLAVRGLYGEGSRAVGDYYQISNQVTLGRPEEQLIAELRELVPAIVRFERTVREELLAEQRAALVDRVSRSFGMLRTARAMPTDGALAHLSNLRLGGYLGLWDALPLDDLARIRVQVQKGHVQALVQDGDPEEMLDASQRDLLRASFLRTKLAG